VIEAAPGDDEAINQRAVMQTCAPRGWRSASCWSAAVPVEPVVVSPVQRRCGYRAFAYMRWATVTVCCRIEDRRRSLPRRRRRRFGSPLQRGVKGRDAA